MTRTRYVELTKDALGRNEALVSLASVTMAGKLDKVVDVGLALSTKTGLQADIRSGNWADAASTLAFAQKNFSYLTTMNLMDTSGVMKATIPEFPGSSTSYGQDFSDRDYYKGAAKKWKPYVGEAIKPRTPLGYIVVPVAIPITSPAGERLGLLILTLRFETITSWSESIDAGQDGIVYIVDQRGQLIAHPTLLPASHVVDFSSVPVVQDLLQGKHGATVTYNSVEKVQRVSAFEPVGNYGWGVVVGQPTGTAFRERDTNVTNIALLWLFIIVTLECAMYILLKNRDTIRLQLDENNDLLGVAAIIKYSEDAIIGKTLKGIVTSWNKGAERIYGYTAEEMIGQPIEKIVPKNRQNDNREILEHVKQGQGIEHLETVRLRKDGTTISVSLSASPVKDIRGKLVGVTVIARDISVREKLHKAEIKLLTVTALKEANEELEAFSYSVSHDLRAPLRAIDGFSKILEHDYAAKLGPDGKHLIDTVINSSQRMGALIDDLLAFSRLGRQTVQKQQVNMHELLAEVYEEQKQNYPKRKIRFELHQIPAAQADRALMRQVWVNLISNALKYTKNQPTTTIQITATATAADVVYQITDNGAGFDMKYVDKLFGVFQRLHDRTEFEGTGVGLAIVKRIVTRHGGKVWAEGKVDEGATIYVSLPRASKK